MTHSELRAAFEIEYARDSVLRALVALSDKETCFMAWSMGHLKGQHMGLDRARDIFTEVRNGN